MSVAIYLSVAFLLMCVISVAAFYKLDKGEALETIMFGTFLSIIWPFTAFILICYYFAKALKYTMRKSNDL